MSTSTPPFGCQLSRSREAVAPPSIVASHRRRPPTSAIARGAVPTAPRLFAKRAAAAASRRATSAVNAAPSPMTSVGQSPACRNDPRRAARNATYYSRSAALAPNAGDGGAKTGRRENVNPSAAAFGPGVPSILRHGKGLASRSHHVSNKRTKTGANSHTVTCSEAYVWSNTECSSRASRAMACVRTAHCIESYRMQ